MLGWLIRLKVWVSLPSSSLATAWNILEPEWQPQTCTASCHGGVRGFGFSSWQLSQRRGIKVTESRSLPDWVKNLQVCFFHLFMFVCFFIHFISLKQLWLSSQSPLNQSSLGDRDVGSSINYIFTVKPAGAGGSQDGRFSSHPDHSLLISSCCRAGYDVTTELNERARCTSWIFNCENLSELHVTAVSNSVLTKYSERFCHKINKHKWFERLFIISVMWLSFPHWQNQSKRLRQNQ